MATAIYDARPRVQLAYDQLLQVIEGKPPGMPLPPVPELMNNLGVSQLTVQRAYDVLERQGLIERQRGRGVFVADRIASGEIAIVLKPSQLKMGASHYYAAAGQQLINLVQSHSTKLRGQIHTGENVFDSQEHTATLDLLNPSVRDSLRGVFTFHDLYDMGENLWQAGIPTVVLGSQTSCPSVCMDRLGGMEVAVRRARQQGAQKIVWISMAGPKKDHEDIKFTSTNFGYRAQPPWGMVDNKGAEFAGYEVMKAIWQGRNKPDAIIATDDMLCNGVLRAMLQIGIEPPEDVKLITFANKGVPLHYHKPVSRVEYDWRQQCQQAVDLLLKLAAQPEPLTDDDRDEKVFIKPEFVEGKTL